MTLTRFSRRKRKHENRRYLEHRADAGGDQRAGHVHAGLDHGAGDLHPPGGAVLHGGVPQSHHWLQLAGGLLDETGTAAEELAGPAAF